MDQQRLTLGHAEAGFRIPRHTSANVYLFSKNCNFFWTSKIGTAMGSPLDILSKCLHLTLIPLS